MSAYNKREGWHYLLGAMPNNNFRAKYKNDKRHGICYDPFKFDETFGQYKRLFVKSFFNLRKRYGEELIYIIE